MITLTLNVPNVATIMAAGYTTLRVLKSGNQTSTGTYAAVGTDIPLVSNQTAYSFVDPTGSYADWYETEFVNGSTPSSPSRPQPGYMSDLFATVRDLLGVTTNEVSDSQLQGYAYLATALATARGRFESGSFDAALSAGGIIGDSCLGALAHLLASMLAPRMVGVVMDMEQFKDYRYQRNRTLDWNQTAATLRAMYEQLISQANNEVTSNTLAYVPPIKFGGPTRGGYDTSGGLVPAFPAGGVNTPAQFDELNPNDIDVDAD